jgi:phosphate-selective porin OprO/OprP
MAIQANRCGAAARASCDARLRVLAAALAIQMLAAAANAQSLASSPAALSDNLVTETSWEEAPVATESASTNSELSLAKRVEALERYIREQEQVETAAAQEEEALPEGQSEPPKDTCKELEPIVKPTFTPFGRIYVDGVTYDDDDETAEFFDTDRENEFGLRTFRIGGQGYVWENVFYTFEFEIRGGPNSITYKDIYIEQQNIPGIGHFRAGHFKEPLGLEEFGSDRFNTFMEKSPATQAFAPSRNFGVMIWNNIDPCQELTWFTGLFRADSPDAPNNSGLWRSDNNDWSYDARLAWLPYYDEPSEGRYLWHLGGSYSYRHIGGRTSGAAYNQNVAYSTLNGLAEFSKRGWVGTQGPLGFGAEADTDEWNQLNSEFLVIWGSASVQAEYFQLLMTSGETYQGGYVFGTYFLTGESRQYRKENKTTDRTIPFEPFFWVDTCKGGGCGRGAWELAVGYSWVDLEDGEDIVVNAPPSSADRRRGFNHDFIVGVNWYQNPWARVTIDYTHEILDYVDGDIPDANANIFGVRWQVDW